jgi:4-amino-4-deoxy-L-arabinose transferase-like glycosyltransferase
MSDTRWAALLFAAAFLARLVTCLGSAIFGTDSCHYLLMADWMREGRLHDALLIAYHPMYPLLIAAARAVFASSEQAGNAISVVLGAAASVPLFLTLRSVFGRPAAVLATLLYAFSPTIVEVQSEVMTEGTFIFFLFSSMWLTHRILEEPSLERGAVLGAAAAGAFLTRPEGLLALALAVGWPLFELVRRRQDLAKRAGGVAVTVVVLILLLSPYLLWVKSVRGRWGLSVRPAAVTAEGAVGLNTEESGERNSLDRRRLYRIYFASMFHLTLYGALIPFYVVGFASLKGIPLRKALIFFSFPLGQLGGVLYALQTATFMSERYLMAGMSLMGVVAAMGMVTVLRGAARRWPESRFRPLLCGTAFLLVVGIPLLRCLKVRHMEYRSYPAAAAWILAHGPRPKAMTGLEQVAYYCGSRSYYSPRERGALIEFLKRQPLDYFVYSEKDVQGFPKYVALLRSFDRLEPAVVVEGGPGTAKVYIHRVK